MELALNIQTITLPTQIWVGESAPDPALIKPARIVHFFGKPGGGFWSAPEQDSSSAWLKKVLNPVEQMSDWYKDGGIWRLECSEARVLCLETPQDVTDLKEAFPYDDEIIRAATANGLGTERAEIDWCAVSEIVDAVHLAHIGAGWSSGLRSWEIESVWWARWCFANAEQIAEL